MNPYKSAPSRSFWSRAVTQDYSPSDLLTSATPLVRKGENVVSAGSCFASHLVSYLERAGYSYLRTETCHPALRGIARENLGYSKFSAAYGNIYTVRQLLQLLRRCLFQFSPTEDRWVTPEGVIDALRPGLKYYAVSNREFDLLTRQHLQATQHAFRESDVFIFTLGLTEAWVSRFDGTVFPACPGTVAGSFDPERHTFKNFSVAEIVSDLGEFLTELRRINPGVRVILSVSPVPLVATATGRHVISASVYSKSVLRVAAEEASNCFPEVLYFPAYEIVTGSQAPKHFFDAETRRNVSSAAVEEVMRAFLKHCEGAALEELTPPVSGAPDPSPLMPDISGDLSRRIVELECEEMMTDPNR